MCRNRCIFSIFNKIRVYNRKPTHVWSSQDCKMAQGRSGYNIKAITIPCYDLHSTVEVEETKCQVGTRERNNYSLEYLRNCSSFLR